MAHMNTKIKEYCKANSINQVDFLEEVKLQDDGQGIFIAEWNISSLAKPTD